MSTQIPTYIFHIRDNQKVLTPEQIAEYERMWNDLMATFEIVPVRPQHDDKLEITLFANPEKALRHDGKLDETEEWFHAYAEHIVNVNVDRSNPKIGGIHLHGGYGDCESNCIYLDAKQALSLLDWLEQQKTTLRQLAKEHQ